MKAFYNLAVDILENNDIGKVCRKKLNRYIRKIYFCFCRLIFIKMQ
jgi:hypothetical protein